MRAPAQPVIMGYWENWGTYQNFPMPNNAQGSTNPIFSGQMTGLTAIAYAFLEVTEDGTLKFSDSWSDLSSNNAPDTAFCTKSPASCPGFPEAGLGNFNAFVNAPVAYHVLSVGGAGHDASWENAFAHPDQFVASLKTLVTTYQKIEWLDIDYEPLNGISAQNIPRFINLVAKINQALPGLMISYTIQSDPDKVANFKKENWQKLSPYLTYVNIMAYDMFGSFNKNDDPNTASASALVGSKYSGDATRQALNQVGIPNEKIVLGIPMYGRAVGGVPASGLRQPFTQAVHGDLDDANCSINLNDPNYCGGMIQYKTLIDQKYVAQPVMVNGVIDSVYAYDDNKKIFVSYDNAESAKAKAQYAVNNKLGGVMFWAIRFDKPVDDAQSILAAVDSVYGIVPHAVNTPAEVKLELTNNDPTRPVTISLVSADKSNYYPFPPLTPKGQPGSDVTYSSTDSAIVKTLMSNNNILVLLTPKSGEQLWCKGSLNLSNGAYHHIQVYYDTPVPNCLIN